MQCNKFFDNKQDHTNNGIEKPAEKYINHVWEDISIKDLAYLIKGIIGFEGELKFDTTKPDGTPRKLLDVNRLFDTGWNPNVDLKEGILKVYKNYTLRQ